MTFRLDHLKTLLLLGFSRGESELGEEKSSIEEEILHLDRGGLSSVKKDVESWQLAIKKKTWLSQRLSLGKGYGSLAVEEEKVGSDGRKTVTATKGKIKGKSNFLSLSVEVRTLSLSVE